MSAVSLLRLASPAACRRLAILACAAGVGVLGVQAWAPRVATLPPGLAVAAPAVADTAALARWFGAATQTIRVSVIGLIAAPGRGAAVLRLNGGPPQAYAVGESLADGVTLAAVDADGVQVAFQDSIVRIAAPALPEQGVAGITRQTRQAPDH